MSSRREKNDCRQSTPSISAAESSQPNGGERVPSKMLKPVANDSVSSSSSPSSSSASSSLPPSSLAFFSAHPVTLLDDLSNAAEDHMCDQVDELERALQQVALQQSPDCDRAALTEVWRCL